MPRLTASVRGPRRQRGMATLVIVAVLFFVLSLVTAYTNRNLIFEQRTASNQFRSTLALEAAEAGAEWVISQLNAGLIDADCLPTNDVTATSFRQRYLTIAADTGVVTPIADFSTSCVSDGAGGWNCSCPTVAGTDPAPAAPAGAGIHPAFRARLTAIAGTQPGVMRLEVNACTVLDADCLQFVPAPRAVGNEGRASTQVLLALRNGLAAAPVAAITVRGDLNVSGAALGAFNPDAASGGYAIHAGGAVEPTNLRLGSAPGSPADPARMILPDSLLDTTALPDGDRLFGATFSTTPEAYRDQPGAVRIDCGGGCDGNDVRDAVALNPGRVLWLDGDVALDGADIGSAAQPVMMVVDGDASIEGNVFGVVYVREQLDGGGVPVQWDASGAGQLTGALIVEGSMGSAAADASFTVLRDGGVLDALQRSSGSFVRVPGGWRDF